MAQALDFPSATAADIHAHRVLILDFGGQYTQLIARRVRECGVYSEIHPWDMDEKAIREFSPAGVVLSGGPESVNLDDPPRVAQTIFEAVGIDEYVGVRIDFQSPSPIRRNGLIDGNRAAGLLGAADEKVGQIRFTECEQRVVNRPFDSHRLP